MKAKRFFAFVAGAAMLFGAVGCENLGDDTGAGDSSDAVITVSPSTITATLAGDEKELTVTSNAAWVVSLSDETVEGVTIDPMVGTGNGTVKVTIAESATDRTFSIKFTATKMTEQFGIAVPSTAETEVAVYQNAEGVDRVTTNVKEVRALLKAMNLANRVVTDVPEQVAAMTLTGVVVGSGANGNMNSNKAVVIQDDSTEPESGLTLRFNNNVEIAHGTVIELSLAGATTQSYDGLLQITPATEGYSTVTTLANVEPIAIETSQCAQYESQYVKFSGLSPQTAGVVWSDGKNNGIHKFNDATGTVVSVWISKYASFKSETIPSKSGSIAGVASMYNGGAQIQPQSIDDIQLTEEIEAPEAEVVTIAEITKAGLYKVENAWVVGYTGNGPILTDESGAFINTYIYGSTYKTLGQKVTVEGSVSVRQGGFQFNTPTITALEGTVDVVYPTPTSYEGAELADFCDKYAASGAAYLCEYVSLKGVVIKSAEGHYGISFSGVDGAKYEGSLSKTPAESLGLEALIGSPVVLCGFVTDYNAPHLSITATSVEVDATAVGIFAETITGVPAEGVTGATHNITVVGVESVSTEVDGAVVTEASVSDNVLTYSVSANTDKAREGWIKLSAEGVETVTIAVKQSSAIAYNFMSDAAFVDSSENYKGESKVNGSETANGSGFKLGTSSAAGYFASKAVGVEGDVTLEFYAVAWKGNTNTLYVRKQGSTDILGQFQLKGNDGATSKAPYIMTLTDENYYSVAVPGVTANTVLEFSTDVSFTKASNNSGRAIVVGVHLVGGTPSTPSTPEPEQPEAPVVKTLPYAESFASGQGDFTLNNVLLPEGSDYVWKWASYDNVGYMQASAYVSGAKASESWLVSPEISLNGATAPELTFTHLVNYANGAALADILTLWVKEATATEWTQLTIHAHGTGSNWDWVESGAIDLSAYIGKNVNIAFKYTSDTTTATTWRVKNFKVAEKGATVEPEQPGQGGGEGGETPETPVVGGTTVTVATSGGDATTKESWTFTTEPITIVVAKGNHTNAPRCDADHVRVYGTADKHNTYTITSTTDVKKKIHRVVLTCKTADYATALAASAITTAGNEVATATASGTVATIVIENGTESIELQPSAQFRTTTVDVTYTE